MNFWECQVKNSTGKRSLQRRAPAISGKTVGSEGIMDSASLKKLPGIIILPAFETVARNGCEDYELIRLGPFRKGIV